jgi:predicted DCC family thiol-disulfide oxidoreductase YuxK
VVVSTEVTDQRPAGPVVFVDADCLLCLRSVRWIVDHDPVGRFSFAPLSGDLARRLVPDETLDTTPEGTVVLFEPRPDGQRISTRSRAVGRILACLDRPWCWLGRIVEIPGLPLPLDAIYRFVARRRIAWFGRSELCLMASPEIRPRFLELAESPLESPESRAEGFRPPK